MAVRKLKSKRGASITFALLLFLVCAVVSSVVIVAGTAAAGRMSQLAQMDQRYYAVTSAAELLRDLIDGKKVTVECSKETLDVVSVKVEDVDAYGNVISPAGGGTVPVCKPLGTNTYIDTAAVLSDLKSDSIVAHASARLVQSLKAASSGKDIAHPLGDLKRAGYEMPLASDSAPATAGAQLGCTIAEEVTEDGLLVYVITNTSADSRSYNLELVFASNIKNIASDSKSKNDTVTLAWKLHSLKIKRASEKETD